MIESGSPAPAASSAARALVHSFWLTLFGVVLLRTAWIGDDAYFTFRTIDNFVHGYGLRWNVAERVQTYTHPLWLALVAAFYAVTGEPYFTAIAISIALTLATIWFVLRFAPSLWAGALGLTVLACSRAFVDYSTSGLENPLTNLLLVLFLRAYLTGRRGAFTISFIAALLLLNRLDLAILVLPPLVVMLPVGRRPGDYVRFAAGFLPVVAWELFSLVYYGFAFPNTIYAKLNTGIPESSLLEQGFLYLLDSLTRDPLTLLVISFTAAWAIVANPQRTRPIGIGMLAYIGGVVYAGGDFMSGRMLAAPLVGAAVLLAWSEEVGRFRYRWLPIAATVVLGINGVRAIVEAEKSVDPARVLGGSGVSDERFSYFESSALVNFSRTAPFWPASKWIENGLQARREHQRLLVFCCDGMIGYSAGPAVHIIDTLGLGDPLLARLPAQETWRVGHYPRAVPRGYAETIETGINQIQPPGLAGYYNRLSLITRAPIWDRRRLRTIARMTMGRGRDGPIGDDVGPRSCGYALLTAALHAPVEGGQYSLTTESLKPGDCPWVARTSVPWIRLLDRAAGTTAGTLNFVVTPHQSVGARTGTLMMSWADSATTFTIVQEGLPNCSYRLTPPGQAVLSSNREYSFLVAPSDPSCGWKAEPAAPWVVVTHGSPNTGTATVVFKVLDNGTHAQRMTTIAVNGLLAGTSSFAISQAP